VAVAKILNISSEKIVEAINSFKPLPHRLEFVIEKNGIKFYNDSLSTIPQAVIEAITNLGEDVETLLAGGYDREVDLTALGPFLAKSSVKNLILFPTTGEKIWDLVFENVTDNRPQKFDVSTMQEAVETAFKVTSPGKIVLLSPAASSFNLFKDYADRGDQFKKAVLEH
jgi:UDP-N-acetylmuramoyl-L-alanine---L-glutamate ligase